MQVQLTPKGRFILVAETDKENALLFEVTNTARAKGIQLKVGLSESNEPDITPTPEAPKKKAKQYVTAKQKTISCPVEGCTDKLISHRSIANHVYRKHGIRKDGTTVTEFVDTHDPTGKGMIKVKAPALILPDGTMRLIPNANKSLLDD